VFRVLSAESADDGRRSLAASSRCSVRSSVRTPESNSESGPASVASTSRATPALEAFGVR
jgi:hypothetical protein